ncbi:MULTISPECIES: hypothetical protein [Acinetobacter calcoaceticus/baumannii complex]|uniref:hypothetical protein n=1 Tax=Acinetobacter calcoaceticus/baumannii complex TaxID=909768 RepID=UPI0004F523DC|nr:MULTISPECIES: hypothetical protein [Acinetobacter calcoaceticus/baumannii complex]KRJ11936.1 hypothetical protein APC77_08275 [Acinetobacter nosocomialis]OTL04983.1 hypothetical protein B9X83_03855 [Acinetobacter nosocomialis]OUR05510.1 hypothetical protein B4R78_16970 [Acinetobacter nosocomialis]
MSYKLIKISVLSTIFLIGCGEESKREENEYEKNMLTIEAENFNDKVNLNGLCCTKLFLKASSVI